MDVRIGFKESARELSLRTSEEREALLARVREAIASGEGVLEFTDEKGNELVVRAKEIAFVEVGSTATRTVGFAGK